MGQWYYASRIGKVTGNFIKFNKALKISIKNNNAYGLKEYLIIEKGSYWESI